MLVHRCQGEYGPCLSPAIIHGTVVAVVQEDLDLVRHVPTDVDHVTQLLHELSNDNISKGTTEGVGCNGFLNNAT